MISDNEAAIARVYDALLGGKDNFRADRAVAAKLTAITPFAPAAAMDNRLCLQRVVGYLAADCGIRQFLDIGCGLPAYPNVVDVAQKVTSDAHVLFVDNDELVGRHAQALLTGGPEGKTDFLLGDLRMSAGLLEDRIARDTLDLSQPVGLLLFAVLHFVPDDGEAFDAVRGLVDALPPGSYVGLTHATFDSVPWKVREAVEGYAASMGYSSFRAREHREIAGLLNKLPITLEPPGLVYATDWRAHLEPGSLALEAEASMCYAVVARKN